MNNPIPQEELDSLLSVVKKEMKILGLHQNLIDGARVVAIHPDYWEISLFVPSENTKASSIRKPIEWILRNACKVNMDYCAYFRPRKDRKEYEWYFRHPNIPQEINDLIEAEIDAEQGSEIGMGLPIPSGCKSKSDTAFLSLKDEWFNAIKNGEKTVEYRNLNQYYCDKFFSPGIKKKYVKLNRGYQGGSDNQMVFEIADIVIVSEMGDECPAVDDNGKHITSFSQLPSHFAPAMYGIKLGNRIS